MESSILLRGYRYSVYNRIVRVALAEKAVSYHTEEIDPFAPTVSSDYLNRHPFGRVPVLSHGSFDIYETSAILRYIDAIFPSPSLSPKSAQSIARVSQVVSIVDSYGYIPMVRKVFAHRVFRPLEGDEGDEKTIAEGIHEALPVLKALDRISKEGLALNGREFTIADCHLAPMIAYFAIAPEGLAALQDNQSLAKWWKKTSQRMSVISTNPFA